MLARHMEGNNRLSCAYDSVDDVTEVMQSLPESL